MEVAGYSDAVSGVRCNDCSSQSRLEVQYGPGERHLVNNLTLNANFSRIKTIGETEEDSIISGMEPSGKHKDKSLISTRSFANASFGKDVKDKNTFETENGSTFYNDKYELDTRDSDTEAPEVNVIFSQSPVINTSREEYEPQYRDVPDNRYSPKLYRNDYTTTISESTSSEIRKKSASSLNAIDSGLVNQAYEEEDSFYSTVEEFDGETDAVETDIQRQFSLRDSGFCEKVSVEKGSADQSQESIIEDSICSSSIIQDPLVTGSKNDGCVFHLNIFDGNDSSKDQLEIHLEELSDTPTKKYTSINQQAMAFPSIQTIEGSYISCKEEEPESDTDGEVFSNGVTPSNYESNNLALSLVEKASEKPEGLHFQEIERHFHTDKKCSPLCPYNLHGWLDFIVKPHAKYFMEMVGAVLSFYFASVHIFLNQAFIFPAHSAKLESIGALSFNPISNRFTKWSRIVTNKELDIFT